MNRLLKIVQNIYKKNKFLIASWISFNNIHPSISLLNPDKLYFEGKLSAYSGSVIKCHQGEVHFGSNFMLFEYAIIDAVSGKIIIGDNCTLNPFSIIRSYSDIIIGNGVRIGPATQIISLNHKYKNEGIEIWKQGLTGKKIVIGNNVWIGANVLILPGVNIGSNVIIGAGSVITKDVESNSLIVGNPARRIKSLY